MELTYLQAQCESLEEKGEKIKVTDYKDVLVPPIAHACRVTHTLSQSHSPFSHHLSMI